MESPTRNPGRSARQRRSGFATSLIAPLLLAAATGSAAAQDLTVQKLSCQGNEPFWSLEISQEEARLTEMGETERLFRGSLSRLDYLDPPWSVWRGRGQHDEGAEEPRESDLVAVFRAEVCLDSMSEEGGPFERRAVLTLPDGRLVSGCCRAAVGLDANEAPLADFEDVARGDWTGFLPRLAETLTGCVDKGFVGPVDKVLGAWPLPRDQGLVRALMQDGARQDCVAEQASGQVLLSDAVSDRAAKGRSEGDPSFYAAALGPPLATCGRLEKVVLPEKGMLGWLHYKGPDCSF
jgi:uncharacterized membrane protein